ncbi:MULTISPECIES: hypothetical protein [Chelatococcus]|uniref:hypothetical protein n=1 Tax=Chelatococcus TaxID=28209 RepID=UPI00114734FE|nr:MULTISPECIES: hypothetical protein [Chelatococcus]
MNIPDNLLDQITESARAFLLHALPYDRADNSIVCYLHGLDATELLIRWFNWSWRTISARPRDVYLSGEFIGNSLRERYKQPLEYLLSAIKSGADLRKYQSRRIDQAVVVPGSVPLKRRQDIDLMLNFFGIYHLHMSDQVEDDGFVVRSDDVLFVLFKRDHAFVIDIMPHRGSWASAHSIKVIVNNWPMANLVYKVEGAVGLSRTLNDSDRLRLLQMGANFMVELDGSCYFPGPGISASGVSIDAVRSADHVMMELERFALAAQSDSNFVSSIFVDNNIPIPINLTFKFYIDASGFGLIEPNSQTFFRLFRGSD